jgi:hypothetical protein
MKPRVRARGLLSDSLDEVNETRRLNCSLRLKGKSRSLISSLRNISICLCFDLSFNFLGGFSFLHSFLFQFP